MNNFFKNRDRANAPACCLGGSIPAASLENKFVVVFPLAPAVCIYTPSDFSCDQVQGQ